MEQKTYEVIIIGGGQAGLAIAQQLAGTDFILLERSDKIGTSWAQRYDSLRLITPKPYFSLPGKKFHNTSSDFPSKYELIDYLREYARPFKNNILFDTEVKLLYRKDQLFYCETNRGTLQAKQVVIATGYATKPITPELSTRLSPRIQQLHSACYKNPDQIHGKGPVLVVGAGNSGISIAEELATHRKVYLAQGKIKRFPRKILGKDIFWWADKLGILEINRDQDIGEKIAQRLIPMGDATYGLFPRKSAKKFPSIKLIKRIIDGHNDVLLSECGQEIQPEAIIWSTGFKPQYQEWIDIPVFDKHGIPYHQRGVTPIEGLYFLGLKWQYRISSFLIFGVGRDAQYLNHIIRKKAVSSKKNKALKNNNLTSTKAK